MNEAVNKFNQLSDSVQNNCKDLSLCNELEKKLFGIQPEDINFQVYSKLMLSIYDLSNHHTLVTVNVNSNGGNFNMGNRKKVNFNVLSIRLKLFSMKMICILISLITTEKNQVNRLNQQVQVEALQIMILSIRLCLDSENTQIFQQICGNQKYCNQLYQEYCPSNIYMHKTSNKILNGNNSVISDELKILYFINKLDILRRTISEPAFKLPELENNLQQFYALISQSASATSLGNLNINAISQQNIEKYRQFVTNIVTEITFKMLRQGKVECLNKIGQYLNENAQKTIQKLIKGDLPSPTQVKLGEVYELYWHISVNKMQSISIEILENFISKEGIFEKDQIFQAIMLTNQPILLEIWFNQANKRVSKSPNLIRAYQCFVTLLILYLNPEKNEHEKTDQNKNQQSAEHLNGLVQLCKQVLLNLFREGKDTQIPIACVLQNILKFMLTLVTKLYTYSICKQLFDNLYSVSTKHSLTQITKTALIIHLYYDLLNHVQNEETYKKFMKLLGNQKSDTVKLLRVCYDMQKGNAQLDENMVTLIKKKPEFAILFAEPKQKLMLILKMENHHICEMENLFQIFMFLFQENQNDSSSLLKIAQHFNNILLINQFYKLSITLKSSRNLKNCLSKFIEKKNTEIFVILYLYLCCFCAKFNQIKNEQYGVIFNRYSKLLKMLDIANITQNNQLVCASKMIIVKSSLKFQKQMLQNNKIIKPDAGQIVFLKILLQKIQKFYSNSRQSDIKSLQFVKFCLFEIFCMGNRKQQILELIDEEQDLKIQQVYANSEYIPKHFKLILLRKLFRSNISCDDRPLVSLNDMRDLILLAENSEQSILYVTFTIQMFKQKGKKFISLLAETNPKLLNWIQ